MKAVSELIAVTIVIGLIVVIAALIGPWAIRLSGRAVNNTGNDVDNQITCQAVSYDFDSSYGNQGVDWDFSGSSDWMRAKVMNTGTISLHSFSFQVYIQGAGYRFLPAKHQGPDSLLKPGQSSVLEAEIGENLAGQVTEVGILNGVCRTFILKNEF